MFPTLALRAVDRAQQAKRYSDGSDAWRPGEGVGLGWNGKIKSGSNRNAIALQLIIELVVFGGPMGDNKQDTMTTNQVSWTVRFATKSSIQGLLKKVTSLQRPLACDSSIAAFLISVAIR